MVKTIRLVYSVVSSHWWERRMHDSYNTSRRWGKVYVRFVQYQSRPRDKNSSLFLPVGIVPRGLYFMDGTDVLQLTPPTRCCPGIVNKLVPQNTCTTVQYCSLNENYRQRAKKRTNARDMGLENGHPTCLHKYCFIHILPLHHHEYIR